MRRKRLGKVAGLASEQRQTAGAAGPCPDEWLEIFPVDKKVGNVRNKGPELALPINIQPPSEEDYGGGDFVSLEEEPSTDDDQPL